MLESWSRAQKTQDSRLVSNENLSEILPSNGWALGQVKWAKMAKSLPQGVTHKKKQTFFRVQTRRHAESFEGLNSSLA